MQNTLFYQQLLEQCPDSVIITDTAGTIIYSNQKVTQMSGYLPEELAGQNPRLLQSGLTSAAVYAELWHTITAGNVWKGELQNRKKSGELYWESTSIAPVRDQSGVVTHYMALKEDISRRKSLEVELREMASVVRNSGDFIGLCTPDLKPFFLNDAGYRMIGLEPGAPLPPSILDCFWPDDLQLVQETAIPTLIREGRWSGEVRFRHFKTGEPVYTRWEPFVIRDESGTPVAWATNSPDLTLLKQAKQALRQANEALQRQVVKQTDQLRFSEEKLATAFRLAPDAVIITRMRDGAYLEVNDGFCAISGYERHEVLGRTALDLNIWVHQADRDNLMTAIAESDRVLDFEAQFRRKDGSILTGLLYARRIEVGNESCIMTFTRDISERKLAEEALQRSNRLYETLYAANQALIRARDQQTLFQEICSIIVERGGFLMAWIGLEEADAQSVRPVASSGVARNYLDDIQISTSNSATGSGPTGSAVRDGASVICNDFLESPSTATWHAKARSYGIRSSAAFPLIVFGQPMGAITIYADTVNYFSLDYVGLFNRLAADISFAMENMEREQQHRQAEQQLALVLEKQADMAAELSLHDEQIRLHISAELHDQIGQSLVLGRIKLGALDKSDLTEADRKTVSDVCRLLEQVVQGVRSLTLQLTPPVLSSAGLEAALSWLCRQLGDDYGLQVQFDDDKSPKPLSEVHRSIVYQAVRELLINVAKHARTNTAQLSLSCTGQRLSVVVRDNGIGFDPALAFNAPKDGCFGLFNIVRQIRHLGGGVKVDRPPAGGSLITLDLPLLQEGTRHE